MGKSIWHSESKNSVISSYSSKLLSVWGVWNKIKFNSIQKRPAMSNMNKFNYNYISSNLNYTKKFLKVQSFAAIHAPKI